MQMILVGVIGSKADAEKAKRDIGNFLADALKLEMSEEKTKVTHTSERARFLGYDVTVSNNQEPQKNENGRIHAKTISSCSKIVLLFFVTMFIILPLEIFLLCYM